MKNAYAVKLMAAKAKMSDAERLALIHRVGQTCLNAMTVALNEQFGFGPDRLKKLNDGFDVVMAQYGICLDTDADYADGELESAVKKIMGRTGT